MKSGEVGIRTLEQSRVLFDHELLDRLREEARDRGLSLTEMLGEDYPKEPEAIEV